VKKFLYAIKTPAFMRAIFVVFCLYHVPTLPCYIHNYFKNLVASPSIVTPKTDSQLQNLTPWMRPAVITASIGACAITAGYLLYRYFNPSDKYYLNWSAKIFDKLKNVETRLIQLTTCTDEDMIINILLEQIQTGESEYNTIELFDAYLKKMEEEITKITKQLNKRVEKNIKHGTTNKALED
jgi:hypothetical protein